jgi:serine/threonine protein kinase
VWKVGEQFDSLDPLSVNNPVAYRYQPPELVKEPKTIVAPKEDVWAMGCILHELMTRKPLFYNSYAVRYYDDKSLNPWDVFPLYDHINRLVGQKRGWVQDTIFKSIAAQPEKRPTSTDLKNVFQEILWTMGVSTLLRPMV